MDKIYITAKPGKSVKVVNALKKIGLHRPSFREYIEIAEGHSPISEMTFDLLCVVLVADLGGLVDDHIEV